MLSKLITSKTRRKVLTLFLTHPEERFYFKNLVERLKVPPSVLHNELKTFEKTGLLKTQREGNIKFYWTNKEFSLYPELKSMVYKTTGLADILKENLKRIGNIEFAFIYGSVAKNTEDVSSDIDILFIGNSDYDKLADAVVKTENKLSREINFSVISKKEWNEKLKEKGFAYNVNKGKKIFLIGNEDGLRKIS